MVPTQILAETFKAEGFDGVEYRSGLAKEINVVLFDAGAAKPLRTYLYSLKQVKYTFTGDQFAIQLQKDRADQVLTELTSESP
jgi:hypothetical protein